MKNNRLGSLLLAGGFGIVTFVVLFGDSSIVLAKEGDLVVHPSQENIQLAPGKKIKRELMVVNSSNQPATLKVSIHDFKVVDEKGKIEFYTSEDPFSAKKWLFAQYEVVTVNALSSKKVEYIVSLDKDMPGKGYTGAISFQLYDIKSKKAIGEPFGTLVRLNVLGSGINTGGTISSFTSPMAQFKDPVKFGFDIQNKSNSNLSLAGDIVFTTIFGKEVNRFKTGQLDIYPGALRNFEFQWSESPIFGAYLASVTLVDGLRRDNIISSWTLLIFLPRTASLLN